MKLDRTVFSGSARMSHSSLQPRLDSILKGLAGYGAERAILFGSAARGDADEWSDIDLIVIKQTDKRFLDRLGDLIDLVQPTFGFDCFIYTPEEFDRMLEEGNPLVTRAVEEGKVIYERPQS